jgi:hypothetical protein
LDAKTSGLIGVSLALISTTTLMPQWKSLAEHHERMVVAEGRVHRKVDRSSSTDGAFRSLHRWDDLWRFCGAGVWEWEAES